MFTDLFAKYKNTTAIGPYLSCAHTPHIQSFMITVDRRGLTFLKQIYRCPLGTEKRINWIVATEVRLGRELLSAGYELRSLLAAYPGGGGSKRDFESSIYCLHVGFNPTLAYPVSQTYKNDLFKHNNQVKE